MVDWLPIGDGVGCRLVAMKVGDGDVLSAEEAVRSVIEVAARLVAVVAGEDDGDAEEEREMQIRWSEYFKGDYEYIETVIEAKHGKGSIIRLVIDIDFKSQFEVARPTPSYKRMLQMLPNIFVGDQEKLSRIVSILCSEAKCSLTQNGLHIPPWRTTTYMHSKWSLSISSFPLMVKLTHNGAPALPPQFSPITTQSCC